MLEGRAILISTASILLSATIAIWDYFLALDFLWLPDFFSDFGQLIQTFLLALSLSLFSLLLHLHAILCGAYNCGGVLDIHAYIASTVRYRNTPRQWH